MNLIEHRSRFAYSAFKNLGIGETFVFPHSATLLIKIDNSHYGLWTASPNGDTGIVQLEAGPRFYTNPVLKIGSNAQISMAPPPSYPIVYNTGNYGSGASGYNGVDPILGPPYAPIDYQLFITPLTSNQFPNTSGSGPAAHLYWTVPSLNLVEVVPPSHIVCAVWFSDTNDPSTAKLVLTNSNTTTFIYQANYVWVKTAVNYNVPNPTVNPTHATAPTRPTGSGVAVPGGTGFNGIISITNPVFTPPSVGNGDVTLVFQSRAAYTLDYFTLDRARNNSDFSDHTNTHIGGAPRPFDIDDPADRDVTLNYFYRLTGYASNGLVIPYNVVGLIHPYTLTVVHTDKTYISWEAPDPSTFPTI